MSKAVKRLRRACSAAAIVTLWPSIAGAGNLSSGKEGTRTYELNSVAGLEVVRKSVEPATHRGRRAVRLLQDMTQNPTGETIAIIRGADFKDGAIEAELAGMPRKGAPPDIRGFVGIAFRVQPGASKYECFYLRMTNGRSDAQVRRNHSVQYVSEPDFPWQRLRKENPGVYESYVDLEPGAWTTVKIVVSGTRASLYVNGADQPCLIVNDLKLGETSGQIALWAGADTEAYFSKVVVR